MPCPPLSSRFNHPDYIRWTVQTMKFLNVVPSPLPIHIPLGSKYSPQDPVFNLMMMMMIIMIIIIGTETSNWLSAPLLIPASGWSWKIPTLLASKALLKPFTLPLIAQPPKLPAGRDRVYFVTFASIQKKFIPESMTAYKALGNYDRCWHCPIQFSDNNKQ